MSDIIRILITFILVVVLIRIKVNLGLAMGVGSLSLAALHQLPISVIGKVILNTISSYTTIQMIIALGLIMVLENIMRKTETFRQMMNSLRTLVSDIRILLAAPPAIIGMVPSIGGAYFSAPLVQEASTTISISPEQKGFINYWFRHIWEYILPTYPGLILASAITHVSLGRLIVYQIPFSIMVVLTGFMFCFRGIPALGTQPRTPSTRHPDTFPRPHKDYFRLLVSLFPIAIILILVALFHIDIAVTMMLVTAFMFIYHRYSLRKIAETLIESASWSIFLIIIGVMFFKEMLGTTGAVEKMSLFLTETGFPMIILFFLLPFLVGMLTGLTIAFVGTTFPLLISLSGGTPEIGPEIGKMAFAFASGFAGVMFSPVHLCFVLTGEYFSANKATIYRYMMIPSSMIMLTALVMWLIK